MTRITQDLGQPTDLDVKISFDLIDIMPSSKLRVEIPKEMIEIDGSGDQGVCQFLDISSDHSCSVFTSDDGQRYVVESDEVLTASQGQEVTFQIRDIFKNTIQALIPTESIQVFVSNEGYEIAETASWV